MDSNTDPGEWGWGGGRLNSAARLAPRGPERARARTADSALAAVSVSSSTAGGTDGGEDRTRRSRKSAVEPAAAGRTSLSSTSRGWRRVSGEATPSPWAHRLHPGPTAPTSLASPRGPARERGELPPWGRRPWRHTKAGSAPASAWRGALSRTPEAPHLGGSPDLKVVGWGYQTPRNPDALSFSGPLFGRQNESKGTN